MTPSILIRSLVLTLVVITLAGCGLYHWQKQGASDADFKADRDACSASGDAGFSACMKGHGWQFIN